MAGAGGRWRATLNRAKKFKNKNESKRTHDSLSKWETILTARQARVIVVVVIERNLISQTAKRTGRVTLSFTSHRLALKRRWTYIDSGTHWYMRIRRTLRSEDEEMKALEAKGWVQTKRAVVNFLRHGCRWRIVTRPSGRKRGPLDLLNGQQRAHGVTVVILFSFSVQDSAAGLN